MELAPCKEKSTEAERVMFTFALAGRDVIGCGGLPRMSLRLPWAKEVIGLSARLGCQRQGECHTLLVCEKSVGIRGICGRQLSVQCAKIFIRPRIAQISTDAIRVAFIKNTDI